MTAPAVQLVEWDRETLERGSDALLQVYAQAMQVPWSAARSRRSVMQSHLQRDGLRAVAALEGHQLVGVAYGYLGAPGQWWHDQVRSALTPEQAGAWLDGAFEVCELHVLPTHHGRGIGRAVLEQLLAGTPARTAVLTTPDLETRARGFYRRGGWVELVGGLVFPGDPRGFAVLARRLGSAA